MNTSAEASGARFVLRRGVLLHGHRDGCFAGNVAGARIWPDMKSAEAHANALNALPGGLLLWRVEALTVAEEELLARLALAVVEVE